MSGWIKFEKDLETDPRVTRIAKRLTGQWSLSDGECNAVTLPAVTLVCGALTRLWIFADSHIRDDNTLDLGAHEIDELIGIVGFCAMLPPDWLREIDDGTVELPDFQEHNGVEAKKKALTQKRVAKHRNSKKHNSVTRSNVIALPDQTRPDQSKSATATPQPKRLAKAEREIPEDFLLTSELEQKAKALGVSNPSAEFVKFREYYQAKGTKWKDWPLVWQRWCREAKPQPANKASPYANAI